MEDVLDKMRPRLLWTKYFGSLLALLNLSCAQDGVNTGETSTAPGEDIRTRNIRAFLVALLTDNNCEACKVDRLKRLLMLRVFQCQLECPIEVKIDAIK